MAGRQLLRLFVANRSFTCSAVRLSYQHLSKCPNYCIQRLVPSSSLVNKVTLFHTSSRSSNEHIIQIQDEQDFKTRVLSSSKPVIIDFFATWCGPCKLLMPRLESLVAVRDGKAVLAKVDIDELSDLAVNYGVEAVPTVVAIKNGKIVDKFVGVKDDAALQSFVDKLTG